MTRDAAIVEIKALREEIQSKSRRLQELAQSVYRKARRSPADETTPIYITYANSITRFAGMVEQGSVRTDRATRVLDLLPEEEAEEKLEKKEKRLEPPSTPTLSPMESLISSYIEEEEGAETSADYDEDED